MVCKEWELVKEYDFKYQAWTCSLGMSKIELTDVNNTKANNDFEYKALSLNAYILVCLKINQVSLNPNFLRVPIVQLKD